MEDRLEQWMPQEINRLQTEANALQSQADAKRGEAEALQRALVRYLESKRHKSSIPREHLPRPLPDQSDVNQAEPRPAPSSNGAGPHSETKNNTRKSGPKPQKQEMALAHLKGMGTRGLTVSELHQQFTLPTLQMTANATRAMLWNLKQDARVELREGRYYYKGPLAN